MVVLQSMALPPSGSMALYMQLVSLHTYSLYFYLPAIFRLCLYPYTTHYRSGCFTTSITTSRLCRKADPIHRQSAISSFPNWNASSCHQLPVCSLWEHHAMADIHTPTCLSVHRQLPSVEASVTIRSNQHQYCVWLGWQEHISCHSYKHQWSSTSYWICWALRLYICSAWRCRGVLYPTW